MGFWGFGVIEPAEMARQASNKPKGIGVKEGLVMFYRSSKAAG